MSNTSDRIDRTEQVDIAEGTVPAGFRSKDRIVLVVPNNYDMRVLLAELAEGFYLHKVTRKDGGRSERLDFAKAVESALHGQPLDVD